jgi:hypothetical protein
MQILGRKQNSIPLFQVGKYHNGMQMDFEG